MRGAASRVLQRTLPNVPRVIGAVAALGVVGGYFSELTSLGWLHGATYLAMGLCIVGLGWRRMQRSARELPLRDLEEAELGALVLLAGYLLVLPLGGVDSPLYPILYVFLAAWAVFVPARVGLGLAGFVIALDVAIFAWAGALVSSWSALAAHLIFFAIFAQLHRLLIRAQMLAARAAGNLAVRARLQEIEDAALQYRLRIAGSANEDVDTDRWVTAAVREVEQAVGNALEVAEYALQSHTVAVFLLSVDDESLRLRDCRSHADDVQRRHIGAREGILGAVINRRLPTRLCGDIKGINWYEGRKAVHSVLAVPLIDRRGVSNKVGFVRGLVVADRLEAIPFTDEDEKLLVATSREVLRAMETERVMTYIRQNQDEKALMYNTIRAMNGVSAPDEVIATTIRVANETASLHFAAFTISEVEAGEVSHRVAWIGNEDSIRDLLERTASPRAGSGARDGGAQTSEPPVTDGEYESYRDYLAADTDPGEPPDAAGKGNTAGLSFGMASASSSGAGTPQGPGVSLERSDAFDVDEFDLTDEIDLSAEVEEPEPIIGTGNLIRNDRWPPIRWLRKRAAAKLASWEGHVFPDNSGWVANVVRHKRTLPGRELRPLEKLHIFDGTVRVPALQSLKVIPLKVGTEVLGTLVCGSRRQGAFDLDTIRALEAIGLQAGQALVRAQLFARTEGQANTDGLTGLMNHRTFQSRFDEEIARAQRTGQKVTLVLMDIDHFKTINDTYGHAAGDLVLRAVANILKNSARTTDVVARYGGEEFALLLPDTDLIGGKNTAERIREAVMSHDFHTELGPLRCTISLGIASYPDSSREKQRLFDKADQCLYFCKRKGRNRSATVDEMKAA